MTKAEAEKLLSAARAANPGGTALFCYQDVADALSAKPDEDMPNPQFARSDVDFEGLPVFVFKRAGVECHCGDPEKMWLGMKDGAKCRGHNPGVRKKSP